MYDIFIFVPFQFLSELRFTFLQGNCTISNASLNCRLIFPFVRLQPFVAGNKQQRARITVTGCRYGCRTRRCRRCCGNSGSDVLIEVVETFEYGRFEGIVIVHRLHVIRYDFELTLRHADRGCT